jgi:hypothetical protein
MSLRYIGSRRQTEAKFAIMLRFDIILGQPFSDLSGSAANDGILIGVVVRFAIEDIDAESTFLQTIKAALNGCLDDMPEKTGTLPTGTKLRAAENSFELG